MDETKCQTCFGHGLWGIGDPVPIGGMDAREGYPTVACPECGANRNPRVGTEQEAYGQMYQDTMDMLRKQWGL